MNKVAVVVNYSYGGFDRQAKILKNELEKLGNEVSIITNYELSLCGDEDIDFKKCIYLDKDMIQGIKLEMKGVRLYNNIGVIEQCDDKRRTYELLKKDFKLPETISGPLTYFYDESSSKSFCKKVVKDVYKRQEL